MFSFLLNPSRSRRAGPCPCPACRYEEPRGRWRRMRHTLVDVLAARSAGDGDLGLMLQLHTLADDEAWQVLRR